VAGNIAFGLRMAGASRSAQHERVGELLALVGLEGFDDRTIDGLSGGEAQRVALARSLAPSPRLLMLDEPLGSLDRLLREQLTLDLRRLLGSVGVSALHVTHDQAEAFAVADRVVVLRAGRVEQSGPPEELWRRPASRFVAEFLGHPNVWTVDGRTRVVPVTALRPVPDGELVVHVVEASFGDGRFRVTADATDGRRVVFESNDRHAAGDRVELEVDLAQVWEPVDRP
jgi:thiamine transport system ATP-binding protein